MRRSSRIALFFAAFALRACTSEPRREERCAQMKDDLAACIGNAAERIDCSAASDADIGRLSDASQGISCVLLSEALPIDGDARSAICRVLGVGCIAAVTPAPTFAPAKYPVVLVNGIDTSPLFRFSGRIVKTMTDVGGHAVYLATLTPYEAPRLRAPELWKRIQEVRTATGAAKVNLICHSLGGLDCRYLVSPGGLGMASAVASITTVGTAHHGTRLADVLLGIAPDGDRGKAVNDFATLVGDWFSDDALEHDVHLRDAFRTLSVAEAPAFNAEITDAAGVYYQSYAGFSRPFGTATLEHDARLVELCTTSAGEDGRAGFTKHDYMALTLIPFSDVVGKMEDSREFTPNDGLTAVSSARWGNFRGCIPADHMEQLGERNIPDVNVETAFDVARFYANVAGDLSARGF